MMHKARKKTLEEARPITNTEAGIKPRKAASPPGVPTRVEKKVIYLGIALSSEHGVQKSMWNMRNIN